MYPCTPLQEGLMSLTMKRPEDYVMQVVLELREDIDEGRLRAAWEQAVQSVAILRTRIVHTEQAGLLQAVLAQKIDWIEAEELEQYCALDKATWMRLGEPLARYALVKKPGTAKRWFVWTAHHAIYDGWSLPLILQTVRTIYRGDRPPSHLDFKTLVKYLHELDPQATAAYWKTSLSDCQAIPFPAVPSGTEQLRTTETMRHESPPVHRVCSDITIPTIIRAAWALIASRQTNSNDVSFGVTVTGRNAPVAGIEIVIGPTIATVPLRVMVEGTQTVSAYLAKQQQQAIEMMPYEHVGLQNIARLGDDAQQACHFQTLLVVQTESNDAAQDEELGRWQGRAESANFSTYPLVLQCQMSKEGLLLEASFDPQVMERWIVERILGQFSYVVHQLAGADEKTRVADIAATTPLETAEIWKENGQVPEAQET
ncbi:hc-toxin synthetase, partial [Stemphylium lycopersici]